MGKPQKIEFGKASSCERVGGRRTDKRKRKVCCRDTLLQSLGAEGARSVGVAKTEGAQSLGAESWCRRSHKVGDRGWDNGQVQQEPRCVPESWCRRSPCCWFSLSPGSGRKQDSGSGQVNINMELERVEGLLKLARPNQTERQNYVPEARAVASHSLQVAGASSIYHKTPNP